jgi:hypothetical protein
MAYDCYAIATCAYGLPLTTSADDGETHEILFEVQSVVTTDWPAWLVRWLPKGVDRGTKSLPSGASVV